MKKSKSKKFYVNIKNNKSKKKIKVKKNKIYKKKRYLSKKKYLNKKNKNYNKNIRILKGGQQNKSVCNLTIQFPEKGCIFNDFFYLYLTDSEHIYSHEICKIFKIIIPNVSGIFKFIGAGDCGMVWKNENDIYKVQQISQFEELEQFDVKTIATNMTNKSKEEKNNFDVIRNFFSNQPKPSDNTPYQIIVPEINVPEINVPEMELVDVKIYCCDENGTVIPGQRGFDTIILKGQYIEGNQPNNDQFNIIYNYYNNLQYTNKPDVDLKIDNIIVKNNVFYLIDPTRPNK